MSCWFGNEVLFLLRTYYRQLCDGLGLHAVGKPGKEKMISSYVVFLHGLILGSALTAMVCWLDKLNRK
jgi:hypothetical protein